MPETSKSSFRIDASAGAPSKFCTGQYSLPGPQVEPEASHWLWCGDVDGCQFPRPITVKELENRINFEPYPADPAELRGEIQELIMLGRLRDEPRAFANDQPVDDMGKPLPITVEPLQLRLPLSLFLQLRPQPIGATINTARGEAFPVIRTGRELARYFEMETPGLPYRLALNYMISESEARWWSPPRQAWVWAALDIAIYSAQAAAWYVKWQAPEGVRFRPRPWECYKKLDVLFDRVPNSTNSADGARRGLPLGSTPDPSMPNEPVVPESLVPDLIKAVIDSGPTPGTPRHPAYPSAHSTYSAAATRLLIEFFPQYREQLCRLADNAGIARLWAGVHWRSDHTFGQKLGTAVAELIIGQLRATGIPRFPTPRPPEDPAPTTPPPSNCKPANNWNDLLRPTLPPCSSVAGGD